MSSQDASDSVKPDVNSPDAKYNPIAICGMALRLPGGISDPSQLWEFLMAKRDAKTRVPESRYNVSSYSCDTRSCSNTGTEYGYFLDQSVDLGALDTSFFSFTKTELEYIDPQQRQLLEVVRECFESAGELDYRGKSIGCYVGSFGDDWFENLFREPQLYGKYPLMIGMDFSLPNRISFEYDLRGPSMSIRTACSSALVCLHEACLAIERGECSAAVVAGCNLIMSPTTTMIMSTKGVLSPDGSCKTFDAAANGYGRSEAINAVYIKPLKDALRDGSPVRAVIRGSAVNNDGKSSGFNTPSAAVQEHLIRETYAAAGINDISQTAYVECHGTGTAIGDPIEAMGISQAFGGAGVYIGSVKPNVGHSEGASGLTSLIKTVLALEHQIIPPNIKFHTPNPRIPFGTNNLKVPVDPTQWPLDRHLRASVNSFGIGGTNAHVIIESRGQITRHRTTPTNYQTLCPHLLVFSANTPDSLERFVLKTHKYLQDRPENLADLSYTLATRREHLPFRTTSIVDKSLSIKAGVVTKCPSVPPKIVMVFTGQGAQWPGMGTQLYDSNEIFRESIIESDRILESLRNSTGWSIIDEMKKEGTQSNLDKASYAQPICTAIQIALVNMLRKLNIVPWAVIGHSSGELAAAYAAKMMTAAEALKAAFYRGLVSSQRMKSGGMAVVGMDKNTIHQFLVPGVVVGCENSQSSVTISGNLDDLDRTIQMICASLPDVFTRRLNVDVAYHSPHMRTIGESYRMLLDSVNPELSVLDSIPVRFYSTVTGDLLEHGNKIRSQYWQSNLESPVLFHTALNKLISDTHQPLLFLEVGPHSTLSNPIRQTLSEVSRCDLYLPCLTRPENSSETFLSALGQMHCQDIAIDFGVVMNANKDAKILTDIPTYCWDHSYSSLYQPRRNRDWRWRKHPKHELLGIRVVDSTGNEPSWRNVLHLEYVPWLRDHKIGNNIVFPAVGYISMVGIGLSQIKSVTNGGFSIRDMMLVAGMVLHESKSQEILTSFRRKHPDDWYDFTISSYDGVSWIEHCHGQIRHGDDAASSTAKHQTLPRRIDSPGWYESLRRSGLDYGPTFQGVLNLSCSTTNQVASGKIVPTIDELMSYPIHPTTLDGFLQTILAAMYKGLEWRFDQPHVPTRIGEMIIWRCPSELTARSWITQSRRAKTCADGEAHGSDGALAIKLRDLILRPVTQQTAYSEHKLKSLARLCWQPSIDFAHLADLISSPPQWQYQTDLLSRLTSMCIKEAHLRLRDHGVASAIPHLRKFQNWLQNQPSPDCKLTMETLVEQLAATPAKPCATALLKVLESIVSIFQGDISPLEILMGDDTLLQLYDYLNSVDRTALFKSLGHQQPKQRILEIGAGTGGTTASLLLHTTCSTYTFTDISAAFFPAAKERFKAYRNISFKTLDIEKDPLTQGFEEESYDLIVAANVLHATSNLHRSLVHVRKLLHPRGKLLLEELNAETKFTNFVTGILPGWWVGEEDGRPEEPYVSPKRWEDELTKSGFNGLDDVAYDATYPYRVNAYMLASPTAPNITSGRSVVIVDDDTSVCIVGQFKAALRSEGYTVINQGLQDTLATAQNVIVLVDAMTPFFNSMDEAKLSALQSFLRQLQQSRSRAFWITRSCQLSCKDPRFALAIGTARTIRSEMGIDFATCEIDVITDRSIGLIVDVFKRFDNHLAKGLVLAEQEYAILSNSVHIARLLPFSPQDELSMYEKLDCENKGRVLTLDIATPGLLDTLVWNAGVKRQTLESNEIEIEVDAIGLNFKDLLIALRKLEPEDDRFGLEAGGVVRRVGSQVRDLSPGDSVFTIGPGSFASSIVVSTERCAKIPDTLTTEDAATMPLVFATVIYSLLDVAQIRADQSILIHSACGGIGIAAIQISQMIGATIYATVGSEDKAEFLSKNYGISRERVFKSHNHSFFSELMTATSGRGVDVVLNSLSGELLFASCRCVAEGGKIIDLAKQDYVGDTQPSLSLFRPNVSYSTIDLTHHIQLNPREGERLLRRIVDLYELGHIRPIVPVTSFPANAIKNCFRHMQSGQHIGKLRILLGKSLSIEPTYSPKALTFRGDSSYLLVGGLGGLGCELARWMAEKNATQLIFLSRSAGDMDSHNVLFHELESQGCSVIFVQGSVCDVSDIKRAISLATKPLKGIFNMSMVLRDESLLKMSLNDWNTAIGPKVRGTWNLHEASLASSLDFFVLFSSMCGIIGMPGQANYASGNTFMDSFIQYRHQLRLSASVLDLGSVEGIGHVAKNPHVLERSKWLNFARMTQKDLFNAVTAAVLNGSPPMCSVGSEKSNAAQITGSFRTTTDAPEVFNSQESFLDNRLSQYITYNTECIEADETAQASILIQFVARVAKDSRVLGEGCAINFLATQIAVWVFDLLMKPVEDESDIDIARSPSDVGLDSLAAVEMRSWWKLTFGSEISVLEITSFPSFAALGKHAHQQLTMRYNHPNDGPYLRDDAAVTAKESSTISLECTS